MRESGPMCERTDLKRKLKHQVYESHLFLDFSFGGSYSSGGYIKIKLSKFVINLAFRNVYFEAMYLHRTEMELCTWNLSEKQTRETKKFTAVLSFPVVDCQWTEWLAMKPKVKVEAENINSSDVLHSRVECRWTPAIFCFWRDSRPCSKLLGLTSIFF